METNFYELKFINYKNLDNIYDYTYNINNLLLLDIII